MEKLRSAFHPGKAPQSLKDAQPLPIREVVPDALEVLSEDYMYTLNSEDREHIEELSMMLLQNMDKITQGIEVGMIIFGSSIRPQELRYHEFEDIDIRLISSAEPESDVQKETVDELVAIVGDFAKSLKESGRGTSDFKMWTNHSKVVDVTSYNLETGERKTRTGPFFLDYNNDDPSFMLSLSDEGSHPLHVSISGVGEDLIFHLKQERDQHQYFSLLKTFRGSKTP